MTQEPTEQQGRLSGNWFTWAWVLPQLILFLLNLRAWVLVRGDLSAAQSELAAQVGIFEVILLLCGLAGLAGWIMRRHSIGPLLALGALGLHVGYLWLFMASMDKIIPSAVTLWMLPETEIMFYQFSLMMPAIFIMLIALARIETGLSRGADLGISFGLLVGIPASAYIIGSVISRLLRTFNFNWDGFQYILILGFIGATALVLVAFIKLLFRLHGAISNKNWAEWIIPMAAGLVAPLAGLALNSNIPFPYDFQDLSVYIMAVLNGLTLMIPFKNESRWSTTGWAARVIFFPFSLYFFLVFLPFFPLSLLAMIAAGAGVLILAPIFLVIVHGRLVLDQGQTLIQRYGGMRVAAMSLACLLVLPSCFFLRCENDRRTLGQAIDTVFSPDYRAIKIDINQHRLSRALRHMEDVKRGIYLPYMTDMYNAIVFRGLVLPDGKADLIRQSLLGEIPLHKKNRSPWDGGLFGGRQRDMRTIRGAGVTHDVKMATPEVAIHKTNDIIETEVTLALKNQGSNNGEFVAPITIPAGVLVTGFWIDVNGTNKPAQLRERKTAIWVYEMIRDMTRRDPGLLIYETDSRLSLKIYPFASGQERRCGITFRFPAPLQPVIRIKDTAVTLHNSAETENPSAVTISLPEGESLVLPPTAKMGLPQFNRPIMAHIILDRSINAADTSAAAVRLANEALSALPASVQEFRVTWANYEQEDIAGSAKTPDSAIALLNRPVSLSFQGGFCPERVIARLLLAEHEENRAPEKLPLSPVPVFIVIPSSKSIPVKAGKMEAFARLAPDMPAYITCTSGVWQRVSFETGSAQTISLKDLAPAPVMAVRKGKSIELLPASAHGGVVLAQGNTRREQWEYWDPAQKIFQPIISTAQCSDQKYAAGLQLWARHLALGWEPGQIDAALPELVADARKAGVMIPETAFVVVETSAQEVTLARKEKQALNANHALEFDNAKPAPAPSILWIAPLALYFLYRLRRRCSNS